MIDCLILGDSLASGVGQARPGCVTVARSGITSAAFVQELLPRAPKAARHVVVSLGVNDDAGMPTAETLRSLRAGLHAAQVTWLLPGLKEEVRQTIRAVAAAFGDGTVDTISQVGADHLHPGRAGYAIIANWTEKGGPALAIASPVPAASPRKRPDSLTQALRWQAAMLQPGSADGPWQSPSQRFAALPAPDAVFGAFAVPRR